MIKESNLLNFIIESWNKMYEQKKSIKEYTLFMVCSSMWMLHLVWTVADCEV